MKRGKCSIALVALAVYLTLTFVHVGRPECDPLHVEGLPSADLTVDAISSKFQSSIEAVIESKLNRYELFEQKLGGGSQPAGSWYQDNAEPIYSCVHEE